ncbi:hypothetical protein [Alcanivorax sediminis]|uniref:Uncharacterized protein n=1 Tax=Alcanivorax sediminis TaxID=2663008 RepID=A0A6N7LTY0_9GAMM|nr:hypothetical protein [Alcanivorax sediminis]MQX52455.1 hypothetical protein [Alcanivorax sediminis]
MIQLDVMLPSLDSLPRIFSLSDLKQRLPGDGEHALDVTLRWLEAGVIRQVAPERPVFYRVVLGEPLSEAETLQALMRTFPSIVVVAGSALWRQGLSSQQDNMLECAVAELEESCNLSQVKLHSRPAGWWSVMRQVGGFAAEGCHGAAMLSPEMAVADAAAFRDVWMPDRDGIDWSRLSTARLSRATEALLPLRPLH